MAINGKINRLVFKNLFRYSNKIIKIKIIKIKIIKIKKAKELKNM